MADYLRYKEYELDPSMTAGSAQLILVIWHLLETGIEEWNPMITGLIELGVSVELHRSVDKMRFIHLAAICGNIWLVDCLCGAGVEVDSKDNLGCTALHRAAQQAHSEVVQRLIEARADPESKEINGYTALHLASYHGHSEVVQRLIEARADPGSKDNRGCTALHFAALQGHSDVIERLIEGRADPDAEMNNGKTALHIAVVLGHFEVVKRLILGLAHVDSGRKTPLRFAIEGLRSGDIADNVKIQIVEALLWAGADERLAAIGDTPLVEVVEDMIRTENVSDAAHTVLKKLRFCPIWRRYKLVFLIRAKACIVWPAAVEHIRRTRSARKNEVLKWLLCKNGGAPEEIFRHVMSFVCTVE